MAEDNPTKRLKICTLGYQCLLKLEFLPLHLQTPVDSSFGFCARNAYTFQHKVDVVRHETIPAG